MENLSNMHQTVCCFLLNCPYNIHEPKEKKRLSDDIDYLFCDIFYCALCKCLILSLVLHLFFGFILSSIYRQDNLVKQNSYTVILRVGEEELSHIITITTAQKEHYFKQSE